MDHNDTSNISPPPLLSDPALFWRACVKTLEPISILLCCFLGRDKVSAHRQHTALHCRSGGVVLLLRRLSSDEPLSAGYSQRNRRQQCFHISKPHPPDAHTFPLSSISPRKPSVHPRRDLFCEPSGSPASGSLKRLALRVSPSSGDAWEWHVCCCGVNVMNVIKDSISCSSCSLGNKTLMRIDALRIKSVGQCELRTPTSMLIHTCKSSALREIRTCQFIRYT